jgi:hypothetical protein
MNARIHTVPAGTMAQAFTAAIGTNLFEFNLVDKFKDLTSHDFGNRLLNSVAFACDAYIGMAIQREMSNMRNTRELEGAAPWDSYQSFLHYAAGLATSEETMAEAGMAVTPLREQLQSLYNVRTECHDILVERKFAYGRGKDGTAIMEPPLVVDFLANPRIRRDDAETVAKRKSVIRMDSQDDDGVIDVELERELETAYAQKDAVEKLEQLKWDKQRGQLAASFWEAFNLKEYAQPWVYEERAVHALRVDDSVVKLDAQEAVARSMNRTGETSPIDPFGDLNAEMQYKLLHGSLRYVGNVLRKAINDRKVTAPEMAKWTIESRPLLKSIRQALEHPRFEAIGV